MNKTELAIADLHAALAAQQTLMRALHASMPVPALETLLSEAEREFAIGKTHLLNSSASERLVSSFDQQAELQLRYLSELLAMRRTDC